jgi:exonuclease VII large subunit
MRNQKLFFILSAIWSIIIIRQDCFSEELSALHQTNLNLVERLARLEEGQKAIIVEMRTRFESVNKRFELIDQRFELNDKRMDSLENRLNKRMDSLENQLNKRMDSLENQISQQGSYLFAMLAAIISLFAYMIWDRKTAFDKAFKTAFDAAFIRIEDLFKVHIEKYHTVESVEQKEKELNTIFKDTIKASSDHQKNDKFSIPINIQEKFRDILNFMNQFPEMRPMIQTA